MKNKFYGYEDAKVLALNPIYKGINTPNDLYEALSHIWCEYTCCPRMRTKWKNEHMTYGQCSITAFLAQDIFGGEVYGVDLKDGNYHCYNVVNGYVFDLTSEQFGDEVLVYDETNPQTRSKHFADEEKRLRYEYLKAQLKKYSEEYVPADLPGGFFIYNNDEKEELIYVQENIVNMYGCDSLDDFREFTHNSFKGMVHPEDYNRIQNQIQAQTVFGEKRHDYVRYRITTKQGSTKYVEDFGHLLHGGDGKSYFYVYIVDVDQDEFLNNTRNSYAEAEILSMNRETDELTGLFNMSFFYHRVQTLMYAPDTRRKCMSIIHFDIPNFKLFNERNGFNLGDELLCDVAKTLKNEFNNPDSVVSRFSDDHFVVCAIGEKEEDTITHVENVYKKILLSKDSVKRVRIKAGIHYVNDRMGEIGLACDHARLACNSIKGRHDVYYCVYDEMLRDKLRKQQYVVDHIDEAIENEYIKVYYQPVIRVKTGEICGYEALVRWIDPTMGFMPPGDFIDTLEQFHIIHRLDKYVIKRVCLDYKEVIRKGDPIVPASINISRLDFELCDIFKYLEETRAEIDVPRNMLDIEITESALNDNIGHIRSECNKMRELGYKIWLDDFGSGYSSLNTLAEYTFDVLKLDLVFLRNYDHNPKTGKVMKYIIELAKGIELEPLCEGVETEEHFEFLKEIGCERAQGYYFGKPMPLEETKTHTMAKGLKWEKYTE